MSKPVCRLMGAGSACSANIALQVCWVIFFLALACSCSFGAETNQMSCAATAFRGESSCSSSSCHGGAGEKRDQCVRWSKFDVHTRSYATLTLARSARIADVLHIADPVQSARCTVCHAPFQMIATNDALRKVLDPAAGVSCETCHGAAQNWLLSHTRSDFTHQDRVNAGMRDLKKLNVRANTCVACHQNVDADIVQAGHPELIFELDGQAVAEPKHWREATNWSGPETWIVGQAVALREMSWQLANEKAPSQTEFERQQALLWLVRIVFPAVPTIPAAASVPPPELASQPEQKTLQHAEGWAGVLAEQSASMEWSREVAPECLGRLASTTQNFRDAKISRDLQSRRAERLVLGFDRLVAGLNDAALAKRLDAPLNRLFKDAQSLPDFDPQIFANDLETFQKVLSATSE